MSGKAGGKGGLAKNPKKTKREQDDDDDDFLDDLVVDTEKAKQTQVFDVKTGRKIKKDGWKREGRRGKSMTKLMMMKNRKQNRKSWNGRPVN